MPLPFSGITTPLVLHLRKRRATRSANSLLGVLFECLPRPHVFHHLFCVSLFEARSTENIPVGASCNQAATNGTCCNIQIGFGCNKIQYATHPTFKAMAEKAWPKRHGRTSIQSCCLARHGSRHARATLLPAAFDRTGRGFLARSKYPE